MNRKLWDKIPPLVVINVRGSNAHTTLKAVSRCTISPKFAFLDLEEERDDIYLLKTTMKPLGIILCGGKGHFPGTKLPQEIYDANVPILGFGSCMADLAWHLGVEVIPTEKINVVMHPVYYSDEDPLFAGLPIEQEVYSYAHMNYRIGKMPKGTYGISMSHIVGVTGFSNLVKQIWALSFLLSTDFTPSTHTIVRNFASICWSDWTVKRGRLTVR